MNFKNLTVVGNLNLNLRTHMHTLSAVSKHAERCGYCPGGFGGRGGAGGLQGVDRLMPLETRAAFLASHDSLAKPAESSCCCCCCCGST